MSIDEIVDKIIKIISDELKEDKIKPHQLFIYSPVVREKKGEFNDLFNNIRAKGFVTVRIDGKEISLNDEINLIKTNKHTIEVVIDQLYLTFKELKNDNFFSNFRTRIVNAVEQALTLSDGLVIISTEKVKNLLFSEKFACPQDNISLAEIEPRMFSFNSPIGACERCKGIGTIYAIDPDLIINKNLSINEGAILPFNKFFFYETWYVRLLKQVALEEGVDLSLPFGQLPKKSIDIILKGTNKIYRVPGVNRYGKKTVIYEKFDGIIKELERRYLSSNSDFQQMEIQKYMREEVCPSCLGKKLKPEILSITINNKNITETAEKSVSELINYFNDEIPYIFSSYELEIGKNIIKEIIYRLKFLDNVGLSYLTIARPAKTLSGGELQRIRLASQIGTGLTGVLYVLDEPSIGLHPKDVFSLIKTLHNLKDLGNTLIVVEHDRETIESADYLIELGPKAGKDGGKVTFSGTLSQIKESSSITGQFISGKKYIKFRTQPISKKQGEIILRKASQFNLKNIDVVFPLGNLIAVTGVSGSGKSTLVVETLYPALKYYLNGYYKETIGKFERIEGYQNLERVNLVDQSPIGRTPRSNPATYVGFFDDIRCLFAETVDAKSKGFQKARFSFNLKGGRCEKCEGAGVIKIEMQFLSDVYVTCDVCQGKRYNKETLEIRYKEKNIYEVLKMTVDEACIFFENHPRIFEKLMFLKNTGLGYIQLGQSAPTLSGGEAQRIKLANELTKKNSGKTLYILDEPTTGLHFYDIEKLLNTLYKLVEYGNTVIVIEHNLDVIKNCQYIIDLGPDGGNKGGNIVYQGPTYGILNQKKSYTGQYLNKILNHKF